MHPSDDPVLRALLRAPVEEETAEERALVEAAKARGGWIPASEVTAEIAARAEREWATAGK